MATTAEPLALNPNLAQGMTLSISKTIRAPRARVFAAWTDPAILTQWFGPENMTCERADVDLRVGGAYSIVMAATDGSRRTTATGEYTQIVPNQKLQFTWHGCWRPDEISIVTVAFRDSSVPGATDVTILHERIAAEDSARGYESGWTGCLNKLSAFLNA